MSSRDYATMIREINKQQLQGSPTIRIAEVIASGPVVTTPSYFVADLKFDNVSDPMLSVKCINGYVPYTGDIVRVMMMNGGGPLVLGTANMGNTTLRKVGHTYAVFGGTSNYTSTSYVNLLGTTTPFRKYGSGIDTSLMVRIRCTCYVAQITTSIMLGVQFLANPTDYDMAPFFFNTALSHTTLTAERLIPSIGAGDYNVQTRIKITGGTAGTKQVTFDTSDSVSVTVEEVIH